MTDHVPETKSTVPDARQIEEMIACDESPVGIDAKKTHVLILQKLISIEERLSRLEGRVAR